MTSQGVPLEERKAALDRAVQKYAQAGWRMEARGELQATVAKGKNTGHLLHLVLSLVTLGAWLVVWLLVVVFGGLKQRLLSVDDAGLVHDTKV
jgi:hypothetical protein